MVEVSAPLRWLLRRHPAVAALRSGTLVGDVIELCSDHRPLVAE